MHLNEKSKVVSVIVLSGHVCLDDRGNSTKVGQLYWLYVSIINTAIYVTQPE